MQLHQLEWGDWVLVHGVSFRYIETDDYGCVVSQHDPRFSNCGEGI